nr:hypothetical protein [Tanacetum cinerariifolium]
MGKVPTDMELILEHTQQGISHEVSKTANHSGNENVVAARAEDNGNGNNENQIRYYKCQGVDHYARNCTVKTRKKDVAYSQSQLQITQKEEVGIQLNYEEFDFMAAADGSAEVHRPKNCYNNDIFNMFTLEEQYNDLLEPISKPHQAQQNDSNVISAACSVEKRDGDDGEGGVGYGGMVVGDEVMGTMTR